MKTLWPWVLNLYDVLAQQGHKVFIDQCVLKAGDQLTKRLQDALQTSQSAGLVWSSATGDSEWVNREYDVLERQATEKRGFQFEDVVFAIDPLGVARIRRPRTAGDRETGISVRPGSPR